MTEITDNDDIDLKAELMTLRGNLLALEALVEILWADRLAQNDNPKAETKKLKKEILQLVRPTQGDQVAHYAHEALKDRLDAVIERVRAL